MVLRTARLLLRAVDSGDSALYESLRKDEFSGTFFAVRNHKPRSFKEILALSGSNALFYGTICYLKSGLPHGFFLVEKNPSYTLLSFLAPKDHQGHGYCKEALSALLKASLDGRPDGQVLLLVSSKHPWDYHLGLTLGFHDLDPDLVTPGKKILTLFGELV
jgi:RimJ/RimL family protein N-acetyltransferase